MQFDWLFGEVMPWALLSSKCLWKRDIYGLHEYDQAVIMRTFTSSYEYDQAVTMPKFQTLKPFKDVSRKHLLGQCLNENAIGPATPHL